MWCGQSAGNPALSASPLLTRSVARRADSAEPRTGCDTVSAEAARPGEGGQREGPRLAGGTGGGGRVTPRPVRGLGAERANAGAVGRGAPVRRSRGRGSLAGTPGPGGFHGCHTHHHHLVSPPPSLSRCCRGFSFALGGGGVLLFSSALSSRSPLPHCPVLAFKRPAKPLVRTRPCSLCQPAV